MNGFVSKRKWVAPRISSGNNLVLELANELGITPFTAQLLFNRSIDDPDKAIKFLTPGKSQLYDPFLLKDMDLAVNRISNALGNREKILIYGDSDTDGVCATALLSEYLRKIGGRVFTYIPSRETEEDFSLSCNCDTSCLKFKPDLIITVDTGSSFIDGAKKLAGQNIDLIITDHHLVGTLLPHAVAIVNPQRHDCSYPYKYLSGTGVAFKLITALNTSLTENNYWEIQQIVQPDLDQYLDLVGVATVADHCPLTDENRSLVKIGLDKLNKQPRPGFATLIQVSRINSYITPTVICYRLSPKINAACHLNKPWVALSLLLAKTVYEGYRFANKLISLNKQRQKIERFSFAIAMERVLAEQDTPVIVQMSSQFHPGILGIIASKLSRIYHKPAILLTYCGGKVVGSARCADDINIQQLLNRCSSLLDEYGGHACAAGLSLKDNNFDEFKETLIAYMEKLQIPETHNDDLMIDAIIDKEEFTGNIANEILNMSPFGYHNPEPVLMLKNVKAASPQIIAHKHMKFEIGDCAESWEIFARDCKEWFVNPDEKLQLAVSPQVCLKNNSKMLQLKLLEYRV